MQTRALITLLFACLPSLTGAEASQESAAKGQQLHNANCIACHARMTGGDGSVLYTRSTHRVTSLPALNAQVQRCASNLQLPWFEDEVGGVADYLNTHYYHFSKP